MKTLKEIVLPVLICLSIGWTLSKVIVFFVAILSRPNGLAIGIG